MKSIRISAVNESTSDEADLIHRFRNFGEDAYRALEFLCEVDLVKIDAATTEFAICSLPKKDLGSILRILRRQLKRHHLEHIVLLQISLK